MVFATNPGNDGIVNQESELGNGLRTSSRVEGIVVDISGLSSRHS